MIRWQITVSHSANGEATKIAARLSTFLGAPEKTGPRVFPAASEEMFIIIAYKAKFSTPMKRRYPSHRYVVVARSYRRPGD
jgi:hypothetical protein